MRRLLSFVVALLVVSGSAFANGSITAHVTAVRADKDGRGMVFFDQAVVGSASCINSYYASALAFDANTAGRRSIEAIAVSAKATGSALNAWGTGSCLIYGSSSLEDMSYGIIQ